MRGRDPVTGLGSIDYPRFSAAFAALQAPVSGATATTGAAASTAADPLPGVVTGPASSVAWVWVWVAVVGLACAVVRAVALAAKGRDGAGGCALLGGGGIGGTSWLYAPTVQRGGDEEEEEGGVEEEEEARPGLLGVAVAAGVAGAAAPGHYGSVGLRTQPVQPPTRPGGRW